METVQPSGPPDQSKISPDPILLTLLLLSLIGNVTLGLERYRAHRVEAIAARDFGALPPGTPAAPFVAERLGGGTETIRFDAGVTTVLYFHVSTCGWCRRNMANIRQLAASIPPHSRLVLIALDKNPEEAEAVANEMAVDLPHYFRPADESLQSYRVSGTPSTVVVSPAGKVLATFSGAYTGSRKEGIERMFGVTLPGIDTSAPR